MRSERTELTFLCDSARVVYRSLVVLSNPGPKREVELRIDFIDAQGYYDYARGALAYGEPFGAPTFAVRVDGRPVAARCEKVGDLFRFRWVLVASRRASVTVEADASFPWTIDDCVAPDYRLEWKPASGDAFMVSGATREMVFRFLPAVSLMAVDSWTGGAEFERGTVTWRWRGNEIRVFDISLDSEFADKHTDLFPGPYPLGVDKGLQRSYFEVFYRGCEVTDLDQDGGKDSLSTPARKWVEEARAQCRWVVDSLTRLHSLAPLDTTTSGATPPFGQPGLRDTALTALNVVERRNLRYAAGLLWALDLTRNANAILGRISLVDFDP